MMRFPVKPIGLRMVPPLTPPIAARLAPLSLQGRGAWPAGYHPLPAEGEGEARGAKRRGRVRGRTTGARWRDLSSRVRYDAGVAAIPADVVAQELTPDPAERSLMRAIVRTPSPPSIRAPVRRWLPALALGLALAAGAARAETVMLERIDHIHGLAIDPANPEQLYLATHTGLFLAAPDGMATRVGTSQDDLMSFLADPADPETFYASGHPPGGGNLGVLVSHDRGRTWQRLADGAGGPVDFHAMDASPADPGRLYGSYKGLQASRDGGRSWRAVGALPKDTFDLAASPRQPGTLYAAARGGLFVSRDDGRSWALAVDPPRPATLVYSAPGGRLYAFVYGVGLLTTDETGAGWALRSSGFGDQFIIHLAADPGNPDILHAVAGTGAVLTSRDGGRTWTSYAGHGRGSDALVAEGRQLYGAFCESCHGAKGRGEKPEDMYARDDYGVVAPPLDDSAHGWHHSDRDLAATILNGSPRNPRMMPFRGFLGEAEAGKLVAYIKSLWSFRSLACQGARHMRCPH